MYDLSINRTKMWCSSEGLSTLMYRRRTLFAVVSHREWEIGPGSRIAKSTAQVPDFIAELMSKRYCWSLLKIFCSISGNI